MRTAASSAPAPPMCSHVQIGGVALGLDDVSHCFRPIIRLAGGVWAPNSRPREHTGTFLTDFHFSIGPSIAHKLSEELGAGREGVSLSW